VGVNAYKTESSQISNIEIFHLPEDVQEERIRRLKEYKSRRSKDFLKYLKILKEKAKTSENLMPYIFDAAKSGATLGEISDTLREVWGTYDELKT